jgi:hypothetical protein
LTNNSESVHRVPPQPSNKFNPKIIITFFYIMSSNDFFQPRACRTPAVNMTGVDDDSNDDELAIDLPAITSTWECEKIEKLEEKGGVMSIGSVTGVTWCLRDGMPQRRCVMSPIVSSRT